MTSGMVIYGPAACGKSFFALRLARHFGLHTIVEGEVETSAATGYQSSIKPWHPNYPVAEGTLVLTNCSEDTIWSRPRSRSYNYMSFYAAMEIMMRAEGRL